MRRRTGFLIIFFLFKILISHAQKIDNTVSFRDINRDSYFRFHYDNDFFTATDYYYTQGFNFEFVNPCFKKNPINKILFHLPGSNVRYGMSLEHNGFTPTSIRHVEIIKNDRPFAAALMLKSFSISTDTIHHTRLTSNFSVGIIGPGAFGGEMQKTIHRWLNNIQPLGWEHQIQNDIVLNYSLTHEKEMLRDNKWFQLSSIIHLDIGTLTDNLQTGFTLCAGKINHPFNRRNNKYNIYFYNQPLIAFIGYDATLQGGIFNHSSPYVISESTISRITFQDNSGIVFSSRKIYLEYYQTILSKEFETGKYHRWGGIKIGWVFK